MRPITIHLPASCSESWDAMTPTGAGRHCVACHKVVVDFTSMTDAEVLAYLARPNRRSVCGRLLTSQVGRPLVAPAPMPRWRAWLPLLAAVVSLESLWPAQSAARPVHRLQTTVPQTSELARIAQDATATPPVTYRIEGIVLEQGTNQPLPGVTVLLTGTKVGASTDAEGKFVLAVSSNKSKISLTFSAIGYENFKKTIAAKALGQPLSIRLKPSTIILGGMGFTSPPATLWQRLRQFFA